MQAPATVPDVGVNRPGAPALRLWIPVTPAVPLSTLKTVSGGRRLRQSLISDCPRSYDCAAARRAATAAATAARRIRDGIVGA